MSDLVRVLIIDDEKSIREMLRMTFHPDVYHLDQAKNGDEGLEKARSFHPHIIILDLGLPDMPGAKVLRELRSWTRIPVIILTAKDEEDIKVQLLDAGADDFLTKPFGRSELLARVRVALRHFGKIEATPIFESGSLRVDLNSRRVEISGVEVKLTKTEFEILKCLVRDAGKVVSQTRLMKEVWGGIAQEETHYLRIYIKQLRKKIELNPSIPVHIITDPGLGYRLI